MVIVMDVGSIKGEIMKVVEVLNKKCILFIGGYLMVGFYMSGVVNVWVDLFCLVCYILMLFENE